MSSRQGERVSVARVWLAMLSLLIGVLVGGYAATNVAAATGHQHAISATLTDLAAHAGTPRGDEQSGHPRVDVGITARVDPVAAHVEARTTRTRDAGTGVGPVARVPRGPPA